MFAPLHRERLALHMLAVMVIASTTSPLAGSPHTELYQITTGTFSLIGGGWVYRVDHDLPDESQRYVELTIDEGSAAMHILDEQCERWSLYDSNYLFSGELPFASGIVNDNVVQFEELRHGTYGSSFLAYTVTLQDDGLTLNGYAADMLLCFDCPTEFYHLDVHAVVVPEPPVLAFVLIGMLALLVRHFADGRDGRGGPGFPPPPHAV